MMEEYEYNWYYRYLPTTKESAISREDLCKIWRLSDRAVRAIIQTLRNMDNGDDMVIISSSNGKGYYRTSDRDAIRAFHKETNSRALSTFGPLKKVNRILGTSQEQLDLFKELI